MKAPLGWMLGFAAIIAAARFSVATAKDEPGEIVARRIMVWGGGDSSIVLSADEKGCAMRLRRGKGGGVDVSLDEKDCAIRLRRGDWSTADLSLDEKGARLTLDPGPEDSPTVSVTATTEGASIFMLAGAPLSLSAPMASLSAERVAADRIGRAALQVSAGRVSGSLTAAILPSPDGEVGRAQIDVRPVPGPDDMKRMEHLLGGGPVDETWHEPGFNVVFERDGTRLRAFDGNGRSGLELGSWTALSETEPGVALFGKDGRPLGADVTPVKSEPPAYVPTFDAVRPPEPAPVNATAEVAKAWNEWRDAYNAAGNAAKLAAALMRFGGGARDRSFLYALTNRDTALKACAVLKRRYEEATQASK